MDNTDVAHELFMFLFGMTPQELETQSLNLSDLAACNLYDVLSKLDTLAKLAFIEIEDVRRWNKYSRIKKHD